MAFRKAVTRDKPVTAFMLAITRASEICIGIVCAGVVLAGTDLGGARRRLAAQLASILAEITGRFVGTFLLAGPEESDTRPVRRDLIRRVIALEPVIDEALGEASDLRPHSSVFQAAVNGLLAALAGWRAAALHLERMPNGQSRREAELIYGILPQELRSAPMQGEASLRIPLSHQYNEPNSGHDGLAVWGADVRGNR
jgi:hypothetical protein